VDSATAFALGARPPDDIAIIQPSSIDLRLSARSAAVDAGQALPGLNDGFRGRAPDLGAYELGDPLPQYGPREVTRSALSNSPSPERGLLNNLPDRKL
jgi:hypothetical protein